MTPYICTTCGTQHAPSAAPPPNCPICEDERQYVGPAGQRWTTLPDLQRTHMNAWRLHEPNLLGIDSGCVWGRLLTAVRLEDRRIFQCDCAGVSGSGD